MRRRLGTTLLIFGLCVPVRAVLPSWQNMASEDGGRALRGASAVFGNPAAFEFPTSVEGELGAGGLKGQPYGWTSWVFPVSDMTAWGLGWVESDFHLWDHRRLVLSGATRVFWGSWLGARGVWQKNPQTHRVDLDLGGLHRLGPAWWLGWSVEHLTESLDTLDCPDCDSRLLGLGLAWFPDAQGCYGLWADGMSPGGSFEHRDWRGRGGVRLSFGKHKNAQILGGISLQYEKNDWQVRGSGGIAFQNEFFSSLVNVRYALSGLGIRGNAGKNPHQAVSIGVVWDAFRDREDPRPRVRSERALLTFSEEVQSERDHTIFWLYADDDSERIEEWSLVIYALNAKMEPAKIVRRFRGSGLPPRAIRWDADDGGGQVVPSGIYAYRLIVRDAAGNQAWTAWQYLEIR